MGDEPACIFVFLAQSASDGSLSVLAEIAAPATVLPSSSGLACVSPPLPAGAVPAATTVRAARDGQHAVAGWASLPFVNDRPPSCAPDAAIVPALLAAPPPPPLTPALAGAGNGSSLIDVLANDVAAWGALTLVWPLAVAPSHGSAAASPHGQELLYAPAAGYVGADAFSYTAMDGRGRTATCVVSVEVVVAASGPPPTPLGAANASGVLDSSAALSSAALRLAQGASAAADDVAAECGAAGSALPVTMVACRGAR